MKIFNGFVLIEIEEEKTQLGNGLAVKETRGKRDIVCGKVVLTSDTATSNIGIAIKDKVMFPLYASNPVIINDKEYLVVDYKDIILKL